MNGGNLHQGDRYILLNSLEHTQHGQQRLINSLRSAHTNTRMNQVTKSYHQTFEWIFEPGSGTSRYNFASWLSNTQPTFWLAGKPGSGKSTLMKMLCAHEVTGERLAKALKVNSLIRLSFFFWLNGDPFQRTLHGCLCTLLHQLLKQDPQLGNALLEMEEGVQDKQVVGDWSVQELTSVFLSASKWALSNGSRGMVLFLDGLDECDPDDDVIEFITTLNGLFHVGKVKLCVSSRQEPDFEKAFRVRPHLRLQDFTYHDMLEMCEHKLSVELRKADSSIVDERDIQWLSCRVADKAEGVFLWASVAIKSLCISIRNSDNVEILYRRLMHLPSEMKHLYRQMLDRLEEDRPVYREQMATCFALSQYLPLSLLHFAIAANGSLMKQCLSNSNETNEVVLNEVIRVCENMPRSIYACTAGLIEIVDNERPRRALEEPVIHPSDVALLSSGTTASAGVSSALYPVCTCYTRSRKRCFEASRRPLELTTFHKKHVQYLHRSVRDFLATETENPTTTWLDQEIRAHQASASTLVLSELFVCELGCVCKTHVVDTLLFRSLSAMNESDAEHLGTKIMRFAEHSQTMHNGHNCGYGRSHRLFDQRGLTAYRGAHTWRSYLPRTPDQCVDLAGTLLATGKPAFASMLVSTKAPKLSRYYKGYLMLCAARCSVRLMRDIDIVGQRAETLRFLVESGADLVSPQVVVGVGKPGSLSPRPPLLEVLLFILRALFNLRGFGLDAPVRCLDQLLDALAAQNLGQTLTLYHWSVDEIHSSRVSGSISPVSAVEIRILFEHSMKGLLEAFRYDYLFPPIHLIRWHDRGVPNVRCQHHESREDSAVNGSLRTAVGSFLIGTMSSEKYGANELTLMRNCLSEFLRRHRRPPSPEDSEAWMSIENKYLIRRTLIYTRSTLSLQTHS
ncbi:hypothetical protein LTR70_005658 [Exophiala xenobiotica]|uniref:NACHT domain-containing protein n=1 Tax=Lithohypha guttulata TaxID=1690604 RepID=A0ABR0K3L1_9EURO|nr:hypothetical protein LTR24_007256 [Lithohypha guttulata]KAK5317977.1 hypothetical protein LTR70_005658 [Exophiala xenobiotica]